VASRVPTPISGVDIMKLPLSTTEGFVLSRIDGASSVEDISIMSGIEQGQVLKILERLRELGAVECAWMPRATPTASRASMPGRPSAPEAARPAVQAQAPDAHFTRAAPRYPASELEAEADIEPARRKRIVDAFYAIEGLNHYELLGLELGADRKAVRSAYFELSKLFHPDSLFGRKTGPYGAKMETVFKRLTDAYEVLGKKKKREQYDQYLISTAQVRHVTQRMREVDREVEEIRRRTGSYPLPAEALQGQAEAEAASPRDEAAAGPQVAPRAQESTADRRARVRQRLRQRLRGGGETAAGATTTAAAAPGPAAAAQPPPAQVAPNAATSGDAAAPAGARRRGIVANLRQAVRASAAVSGSAEASAANTVAARSARARELMAAGDALGAAEELQLALAEAPDNTALQLQFAQVNQKVAAMLSLNYERQARFEEESGDWAAAGKSWARVSDARPDEAKPARLAAEAILKAGGDLHRAQRYAQRAVDLKPKVVDNLLVLARVCLAAGLKLNASRALQQAAVIEPRNEMVKNLLNEAR